MKNLIFLSLLLLWTQTLAQTSLIGFVTLQNSEGKSAFPAQVKAFGATDTDVASNDGGFTLIFDRKKPGQDAYIEVVKNGYEVVNKTDLGARLPKSHERQRPIKVYLCPMGEWQRYADQYYKVNLSEISKTYQRKLATIQKKYRDATLQNREHQQALARLDEDRKTAEAQAEELAEKFAKANLDDATDRFVLAHRLFTEGKIDSVLLVLDEEKMLADLARAEKDISEGKELIRIGEDKLINGEEAKEKIVEEFMVKARAHILNFQWEEAEHSYNQAITADSLNIGNLSEVAEFLYKLNQFDKAEPFWGQCLKLAGTSMDSSMFLNNLAVLHSDKNELAKAEGEYGEALKIYRALAEANPQAYLPYVATTLNNLAVLHSDKNELAKAEGEYGEALKIYRALAEANPQAYNIDVARTLLGMSYHALGRLQAENDETWKTQGMGHLRAAIERLEVYPDDLPQKESFVQLIIYLANEFESFDQILSSLHHKIEPHENALQAASNEADKAPHQQQIVNILEEAKKDHPDHAPLLERLGNEYGGLAWYLLFAKDFPAAEQAARKGLAIQPELEWINTNLAPALMYQGKWKDAEAIYSTFKGKPYDEERTWTEVFLADLAALEAAGVTRPDVEKARALLRQ